MNPQKIIISALLVAAVLGGIIYLNSQKVERGDKTGAVTVAPRTSLGSNDASSSVATASTTKEETAETEYLSPKEKAKKYELAKEITTPDGFINTDGKPVTIGEFIGKKVVLLDIWTYSCINCQRTTPYLNAWYEKYKDKGFVIIGLHTPEFEFEKVYQNVLEATKRMGIKFPVVLDNDFSTWSAYQNRFWPRKYLIDIDGYIVYDHIGEGAYEYTEQKIQEALKERAMVLGNQVVINEEITFLSKNDVQAASPETYFGAKRNEYLANGNPGSAGVQSFVEPATFQRNKLYLSGSWDIMGEYAEASGIGTNKIIYKYLAKSVYLVAGSSFKSIEAEVTRDGKPVDESVKGEDVFYKNGRSYIKVQENRLYKVVEDISAGEHLLQFIISEPGLQAFAFTFG